MDNERSAPESHRRTAQWLAVAGISVGAVVALFSILYAYLSDYALFKNVLAEHVRAVVGIPMAAVSSFCVVIVLENRSGRIELELAGLKFKGAAGPVILWMLGFFVFTASIRLLW
jgi:hypothetical protein